MAYTDKQGTVITAGDKVAFAHKFEGNRVQLIIGVISGPYTNRGVTYFEVAMGADARITPNDRSSRAVITMSGVGAGQCLNAVKSGFV